LQRIEVISFLGNFNPIVVQGFPSLILCEFFVPTGLPRFSWLPSDSYSQWAIPKKHGEKTVESKRYSFTTT